MKNALRFAAISAAMVAGLAITGASQAQAGVSFSGTFPLPHGVISIGIGDPYFRVGTYVPSRYRVCARDGYGYGFMYRSRWIPVQRYGARWRVCDSPWYDDVYYGDAYYGGSYYSGRFSPRFHSGSSYRYRGGGNAYRRHDGDRWNGHRDQRWGGSNQRWNDRDRGHDRNQRWNDRDRSHDRNQRWNGRSNDRNDHRSRERSRGDNQRNRSHRDRNDRGDHDRDHRQHDGDRH